MEAFDREATAEAVAGRGRTKLSAIDFAHRAVDIAADKKASDIVLLDIRSVSYIADYFVICTGESERQIKAISEAILGAFRDHGVKPIHSEGTSASGWMLIDYGDVIVHIFTPASRDYYLLEKVWGEGALVLRLQ